MSITKKLIILTIILAIFTAYYSYSLSKLDITPKAYITNQGDDTVSVIDLKKLIKINLTGSNPKCNLVVLWATFSVVDDKYFWPHH